LALTSDALPVLDALVGRPGERSTTGTRAKLAVTVVSERCPTTTWVAAPPSDHPASPMPWPPSLWSAAPTVTGYPTHDGYVTGVFGVRISSPSCTVTVSPGGFDATVRWVRAGW
jgi:hypothetical protein